MIGIHERPGSFSDRWISYCNEKQIPFRRVNCLASDIVQQCKGLDALFWHWAHWEPADKVVARQIIAALEQIGVLVFPNISTCWHFDDKVAQKYLLEAIDAPIIPTWVFTNKIDAMQWIDSAIWPKVFKVRCGAGSANVRLVRSRREASVLCQQAFGRGFPVVAGYLTDMHTRFRKTKSAHEFWARLLRVPRTLIHVLALRRQMPREKGYAYFQEFLPDNGYDTRITIIGNRAFGFMRANRPNDFRASGSGSIIYETEKLDRRCVEIAFTVADRIGAQSLAFDFLFNLKQEPMIGEISYCYMPSAVHSCEGHWDRQGAWQKGQIWPQDAILDDALIACSNKI